MRWLLWILGGLVLAAGSAAFLIVWWKLGDQWADNEYKKFGRGPAKRPTNEKPEVIDDPPATIPSDPQRDRERADDTDETG